MPRAAEEENASTIIIPGWCRSRPCLYSSLNITPELEIITSDEMSYLSGDASRARSIGLANASPTIAMALTQSRSMVASISALSSVRDSRVTVLPPAERRIRCVKQPVSCISRAAGKRRNPGAEHGREAGGGMGGRGVGIEGGGR